MTKNLAKTKENKLPQVGRNPDGTFKVGNQLQRQKPLLVGDFLDAVQYVGNEHGVPILVQALRMAYKDAKLMGKVLDKFLANAGTDDLNTKETIQILIQNYQGAITDERTIEVDRIK